VKVDVFNLIGVYERIGEPVSKVKISVKGYKLIDLFLWSAFIIILCTISTGYNHKLQMLINIGSSSSLETVFSISFQTLVFA